MTVAAESAGERSAPAISWSEALRYLMLGIGFGIVASRSQVISWYRIQEMFRFDSFHMYGVLGSAIVVGGLGVAAIRRFELRSVDGERVALAPKVLGGGVRYWAGGTAFGLGWGLTGACPGPIFALIGHGVAGAWLLLAGSLVGTWLYAVLRPHLPH